MNAVTVRTFGFAASGAADAPAADSAKRITRTIDRMRHSGDGGARTLHPGRRRQLTTYAVRVVLCTYIQLTGTLIYGRHGQPGLLSADSGNAGRPSGRGKCLKAFREAPIFPAPPLA